MGSYLLSAKTNPSFESEGLSLLTASELELVHQQPGLTAWLFDDHLVVFDCSIRSLRLYNPSATALWLLIVGGQSSRATLINAYRHLFTLGYHQANTDVSLCLKEWAQLGWLQENCDGIVSIGPLPNSPPAANISHSCSTVPQNTVCVEHVFKLGAVVFSASVGLVVSDGSSPAAPGAVLASRIAAMLQGLPSADLAAAEKRYLRVLVADDVVYIDDDLKARNEVAHEDAVGQTTLTILRAAYHDENMLGTLHAAAVGKQHAVVLSGVSGAGKSTLAAYLQRQGWRFYGDDVVGLSAAGQVLPLPASASIKQGSWPILETCCPELATLDTLTVGAKTVRYLPLPSDANAGPIERQVVAWIFPRFEAGAETRFRAVDKVTALRSLMDAGFYFDEHNTNAKVEQFVCLIARIPCYTLTYSSLNEAQECLQKLMDR